MRALLAQTLDHAENGAGGASTPLAPGAALAAPQAKPLRVQEKRVKICSGLATPGPSTPRWRGKHRINARRCVKVLIPSRSGFLLAVRGAALGPKRDNGGHGASPERGRATPLSGKVCQRLAGTCADAFFAAARKMGRCKRERHPGPNATSANPGGDDGPGEPSRLARTLSFLEVSNEVARRPLVPRLPGRHREVQAVVLAVFVRVP
jgi:hypothetical protein